MHNFCTTKETSGAHYKKHNSENANKIGKVTGYRVPVCTVYCLNVSLKFIVYPLTLNTMQCNVCK